MVVQDGLRADRARSLDGGGARHLALSGLERAIMAQSAKGRLAGRKLLITGGASGIGAAACRRFGEEGASVAILDRDQTALDALAQETKAFPGHTGPVNAVAFTISSSQLIASALVSLLMRISTNAYRFFA